MGKNKKGAGSQDPPLGVSSMNPYNSDVHKCYLYLIYTRILFPNIQYHHLP